MIGWGIFFSIQLIQIDLSQMKWNNLFSLFFYEETAETTIWWNVNINLQSVHFYDQESQVQNKWAASPGFYEFNKCVQHFTIENKGKICATAAAIEVMLAFFTEREKET